MITTTDSKELTLFHVNQEMSRLLSKLFDNETGEIDMEIQAQIDALEPSLEKRCIAIQQYVQEMIFNQGEIEKLVQALEVRHDEYSKRISSWNARVLESMKLHGITKIECPWFTLKHKINPLSTGIVDTTAVPAEFMRTKVIPEKVDISVDKDKVKKHFQETGKQVPGTLVGRTEKLEVTISKL